VVLPEPADVSARAVHIMIKPALTGATYDVDGKSAARRAARLSRGLIPKVSTNTIV
jgi:hypothetical protein